MHPIFVETQISHINSKPSKGIATHRKKSNDWLRRRLLVNLRSSVFKKIPIN